MTGRLLDVSTLPFEQVYTCENGSTINLSEFLRKYKAVVEARAAGGLARVNESFGLAMMEPIPKWVVHIEQKPNRWDEPNDFVWFVGGWGPDRDRYIANAVRKLRVLVRHRDSKPWLGEEIFSTLDMRCDGRQDFFLDTVPSVNDDGSFPWGDFPYGGAVDQSVGGAVDLCGAVSALSEIQDETAVRDIFGGLGELIIQGNGGIENMPRTMLSEN